MEVGSNSSSPDPSVRTQSKRKLELQAQTTRWTKGKDKNGQYYWDEPGIPDYELHKGDLSEQLLFPPRSMDLSSAWAVAVIRSDLTGTVRHDRYPLVFYKKNH